MGRTLRWVAAGTVVGLTGLARGQEAFTFSWVVADVAGTGPANGNGVIEPGEDAIVQLNVSFRPGVGGTAVWDTNGGTGRVGSVAALHNVVFDLVATGNLATGAWSEFRHPSGFAYGVGNLPQPDGGFVGLIFGQESIPGVALNPRNDGWFFRARWRPDGYTPRSVGFAFRRNGIEPNTPDVLLDVGDRDPQGLVIYRPDSWAYNEPGGGFSVVPGPGVGGGDCGDDRGEKEGSDLG